MSILNPLSLIGQLKNGNPQQLVEQLVQSNYANDPFALQLLEMGRKNDIQGLEKFAKEFFGKQGRDFNTELNNLLNLTK